MSQTKCSESDLNVLLCGCGGRLRYTHFKDGKEVMSCNKYIVCLTYNEQLERIKELSNEMLRYKNALQKIVDVNGMVYEYKAWAKEGLTT